RAGEAADIVTTAAFPRYVLFRRDAPGAVQRQLAFTFDQHAEQILFQHIQAQAVLVIHQQFQMIRRLRIDGPGFQGFHMQYIHYQARLARRSAINASRKTAPSRSKKPMAIKSGLKPILSAVTPIKRENRKLAIHAAEPRMPLTVAIWPLSNDSTTSALSMQE